MAGGRSSRFVARRRRLRVVGAVGGATGSRTLGPRGGCGKIGARLGLPAELSAGQFPPLEPPAKRLLRLTRSATRQETLHADIFIQIWPVNPLATGNETPVGPLRRCPVRQTREPREWHRDRPAICKFRDQSIIAHAYALGQCFPEFSPQSTHAMTSTRWPRSPRPVFRYVQFPSGRSRGSSPNGPVPAKTWPFPLPARHARGEVRLDPPSKRTAGMAPREERLATYPSVHGCCTDWLRSRDWKRLENVAFVAPARDSGMRAERGNLPAVTFVSAPPGRANPAGGGA